MTSDDWTDAADVKAQATRLWERGEIVRAVLPPGRPSVDGVTASAVVPGVTPGVTPGVEPGVEPGDRASPDADPSAPFPRRLRFRRPRSRDLATRFEAVRSWVREIEALEHVRVERRTVRHPELGANTLPDALWLDDADAAAALAGRARALARCRDVVARLLAHDERLVDWARRRPLALLDIAADLDRLLAVHGHMRDVHRPGVHLREIDVPGVDGKFVEARRELLADWLDLTLPASAIDPVHRGVRGFARRYGYRDKPVRIRMRSLDASMPLVVPASAMSAHGPADGSGTHAGSMPGTAVLPGTDALALADLTLDAVGAARLAPCHSTVVVTENEVNFLTLPPLPGTLALFGAGYGFTELGALGWLGTRELLYWGDIDTHGFAILDELRAVLPRARSVLMDRETLLEHRALWGSEPKPRRGRLTRLDGAEARLHAELVEGVHGERVRLEQERIGHGWAVARLGAAVRETG